VFADVTYRPPLTTPKPVIHGLQSAMVVGPKGEEIHTDEVGRVRVQFHWDRAAPFDDNSSLWMRVSQGWGGGGYGMMAIPRVGHEVLVAFLEGDPDHPVVVGRVHNGTAPVPHKLPQNKTATSLRSASSPGGEGFNELTFDDARGRELVFVHAERNLKKLVKHDETEVTQKNRHVTVGDNLTKLVMLDETETTGADRTVTVGGKLGETVGGDHTVAVGGAHTESVAKGMSLTVGPTPPPPGGGPAPKPPAPPAGVMKLEAKERLEIVVGAATLTIDKSGKVTLNGVEFEFTATGPVHVNGSVVHLN
jgi:type VI secretion system secreted protein VgrG